MEIFCNSITESNWVIFEIVICEKEFSKKQLLNQTKVHKKRNNGKNLKSSKKVAKMANFRRFLGIGLSAILAEYSVPNIRPIFAEYSAEYSVFGRTLMLLLCASSSSSKGGLNVSFRILKIF